MSDLTLHVDKTAIARVATMREKNDKPDLKLRITVDGGGCSGFQYNMELTDNTMKNDVIFEGCVVTDDLSLTFLKGSTVSFKDDLIGSEFVIDNPNAVSGCGCGTSFSVL